MLQVVITEEDREKSTARGAVQDLFTKIGEGVTERGTGDIDYPPERTVQLLDQKE